MKKSLFLLTGCLLVLLISSNIFAFTFNPTSTTLTSTINMDNGYIAYISTDDTVVGTEFATHNNWYDSDVATTSLGALEAGTDYFLHIYGYDQGLIAGLLGEFSLSGTNHEFSNGTATLLTNTTDWTGNNTGWADTMETLTDLGLNGVSPWGSSYTTAISDDAHWIWAGNANSDNIAYFSTKILATTSAPVPEPATLLLLGSGLAGLAFYRRKRK